MSGIHLNTIAHRLLIQPYQKINPHSFHQQFKNKLTKFNVSMFDEVIEYGGEDEAENS